MAFAASKQLGVTSVREFIEASKRKDIFYAANAAGNLPHLTGKHFANISGARLKFVPFKSTADALVSVQQGQIGLLIENYPALQAGMDSGDLVLLAYGSEQRLPNFPHVQTVAETLAGFRAVGWAALAGPPGLPARVAERINTDVSVAMSDLQERLQGLGVYAVHRSTQELRNFIVHEQETWRTVAGSLFEEAQHR